ncbi:ATP-binding protein [Actinacidiphila rubida]|uniref:ATP-binding protein n=1 Tax=Actinacidiphila rubida TaxID=310780 RepID=UPI00084987CB|nr:ATP-binding protein [Actinacidiphila rubida]
MSNPTATPNTAPGRIARARQPGAASTGTLIPRCDSAPRQARQFTTGQLADWLLSGAAVEAAVLVVSELVTNAVVHGTRGPIRLRLDMRLGELRVTVADDTPYRPLPDAALADVGEFSGRGLALVAAYSTQWGHRHVADRPECGTAVWAQIPAGTP